MGGLARQMPAAATFFVLGGLGALGLPSTSGFAAEFSIFLGSFSSLAVGGIKVYVIIALLGVLLGAVYILWLIQRVFYGPANPVFDNVSDASKLEKFYCGIFAILIFVIGIYPSGVISTIQSGAENIAKLIGG
jgi:NADH-quinone oxidoreductase subunit M